jgi:hypothetical protein
MTDVELMLTNALVREWEAQSDRAEPLEPTVSVRTLLELVLASTPGGIFLAADVRGTTAEEVVAQVLDDLPRELSPWTQRSLDRVGALRSAMPLLPAGDEVRALLRPSEPLPIRPADIPELPPPQPQAQLDRVAAAPVERNRTWATRYGAAVVAAPVGAGVAVAGTAAGVGVALVGGAAAVAAALVAIVLGRRS